MCLPPEFLSSGNRQKDGFSDGGASMDQLTERKEQEKSVENKDKGTDCFFGNIRDAAQFLTGCWMFLMLTIFPLYFGNKYHEIGGYKFSFFSGTSTLILFPAAVLAVVVLLGKMMKRDCGEWKKEISLADIGGLL